MRGDTLAVGIHLELAVEIEADADRLPAIRIGHVYRLRGRR